MIGFFGSLPRRNVRPNFRPNFRKVAIAPVLDRWLEREREQLPLWVPVGIGSGIGVWQVAGDSALFPMLIISASIGLLGFAIGFHQRVARVLGVAAMSLLLGFAAISVKSAIVAAPVLQKVWTGSLYGRIEKIEYVGARDVVRVELATKESQGLPPKVRLNLTHDQIGKLSLNVGTIIQVRARLMPPNGPILPGSYDFARRAWFQQIGATGRAMGQVVVYGATGSSSRMPDIRNSLTRHIISAMPQGTGEIGAALVTGDQANIDPQDAQAMRDSGMAHLLSISGLHVTAVVGFLFLLASRTIALFPVVALRYPVPLLAGGFAAMGAVAYTLLAGAEVPTVRSCIAALLVLLALAMGREALTLRLVAAGAIIVLLFWPEAMAGPSFQLSFAAVATIVILHESRWMKRWTERRDETWMARAMRGGVALIVTGLAIEVILAPITLYHFHRTGMYSAFANVLAIPLTTFVIMPAQAAALMLDMVGVGGPAWWIAGQGINTILALAHSVSRLPGAVTMMPAMPVWAFVLMIFGGLWFGLLKSRICIAGLLPVAIGFGAMISAPRPDILVTADGKHVALSGQDGRVTLLRARTGDYIRDMMLESMGALVDPVDIEKWPDANCSPDICVIQIRKGTRMWSLMATRTAYPIPELEMAAACRRADIVVSDRRLPASCQPQWLKADRNMLSESGGLAFYLANGVVHSVEDESANRPWANAARIYPQESQ
jgi:competence protein ComEC